MTKGELERRVVDAMKNEQEIDRHSPDPSAVIRVVLEAAAEMAAETTWSLGAVSEVSAEARGAHLVRDRIRRAITAAPGEEL